MIGTPQLWQLKRPMHGGLSANVIAPKDLQFSLPHVKQHFDKHAFRNVQRKMCVTCLLRHYERLRSRRISKTIAPAKYTMTMHI